MRDQTGHELASNNRWVRTRAKRKLAAAPYRIAVDALTGQVATNMEVHDQCSKGRKVKACAVSLNKQIDF